MANDSGQPGSPVPNDRWDKLVRIHNHAKTVFLLAEEFDRSFRHFLQPIRELRDALEHIIRAQAAERGINEEAETKEPGYVAHSYDKAIGHEYRAFFDVADWFSVCIRERITKLMKPFSQECIVAVLPDYYSSIRPRVDQICKEIATIRCRKDIAKGNDVLAEVTKYREAIDELLALYERLQVHVPAMVEWRRKKWRGGLFAWFIGILTAVVTAWVLIRLGLLKP